MGYDFPEGMSIPTPVFPNLVWMAQVFLVNTGQLLHSPGSSGTIISISAQEK